MSIAFAGITPEQAFLYLDDVIVIGHSPEHHLKNLRKVFEIMRKFNLKIHPQKCKFFKPEVTFLGHKCTSEGILPDDNKKHVIENYPIPHDKDAARRFVAFANYYRRFIQNFSLITRPTTRLTRKQVAFEWTDECQKSFELIKDKLMNPPILRYPDFNKEFIVTVDASKIGCGGVLSQQYGDIDLPVYYASKAFSPADRNKSTPVQECLAIHFALGQFRPYIYGKPFLVRSDHRSLIYLFSHKNPSPKLTRIRLELEDYEFTIEHIKGKDNVAADALSRISIDDLKTLYGETKSVLKVQTRSMTKKLNEPMSQSGELHQHDSKALNDQVFITEELNARFLKSIPRITSIRTNSVSKDVLDLNINVYVKHKKLLTIEARNMIINDRPSCEMILSRLEQSVINHKINKIQWPKDDLIFQYFELEQFKAVCMNALKNLQIILITTPKFITSVDEQFKLMSEYHNNFLFGGHCGQKRLYAKLRSMYHWKNMTRDIANFVRNCNKCQLNKVKDKNREPLFITPTPQNPFDVLVVDTIGPLPTSEQGNRYAVTMICDLTKYLVIAPIPDKSAPSVAKAIFTHFVLTYGLIKNIKTDLGTEYVNEVITELCKLLQISHDKSTPHRHQTVGTIERNHRVFNEYIRAYISDKLEDWESYSQYFAFCYNITNNSSLNHQYTPYELIFNKKPIFPNDLLNGNVQPIYNFDNFVKEARYRLQTAHVHANELIQKMKLRNKNYYDKNSKPLDVNINDQVVVTTEPYNKHKEIYTGPFIVKEIKDSNLLLLNEKTNKLKKIHKDRIRKYTRNIIST